MAVQLNHTIVASEDPAKSATWFAEILGLEQPVRFGPFWEVSTSNGVTLAFDRHDAPDEVASQHYAFLISEEEFDAIFGRIVDRGIDHYADPGRRHPGEINHNDDGRGVYFPDPDGHLLEILTRRYGSGQSG